MESKMWIRAISLGVIIAALGIPPGAWTALAQEQQGPVKPQPAQTPAPPPVPTGQQQAPAPGQAKPNVTIAAQTNLVNIDAVVTDVEGNVLTNLKKENFRVLDEGQPQQIANFAPSDAPITIVVLMEFSKLAYGFFGYKAKGWAYNFLSHLNQKDWVAFKTFDLKTNLMVDFTHNKGEVAQAVQSLYFPDFSEANLFDAVIETMDEMKDVQGKKAILLLATGFDTFSKHTLDQTLKRMKETDVAIFSVGMAEEVELYGRGSTISYSQAKNQLTTFGNMTGGYAWFPRFAGEAPSIFNSVAALLRSQYSIGFSPTTPQDGRYHKLKVDVLDNQGNILMIANKKGKLKNVTVYARQGYTSPPKSPVGD
jgi:VWFA-related protein